MHKLQFNFSPIRLVLGGILLLIGASLLWSQSHPKNIRTAITTIPGYSYSTASSLSGWSDGRLKRKKNETDLAFAARLNTLVSSVIYHCNYNETPTLIDKLISIIPEERFNEVGLLVPNSLKCGFCHQIAYVLARALTDGGVRAEPFGINGHVVTLATINGEKLIYDADLGVGPIEYRESMWSDAKFAYYARYNAYPPLMRALHNAYRTTADDQPFYSMQWLYQVEHIQNQTVILFELASIGAVVVGIGICIASFFSFTTIAKRSI